MGEQIKIFDAFVDSWTMFFKKHKQTHMQKRQQRSFIIKKKKQ
jgi:hypothetical protein